MTQVSIAMKAGDSLAAEIRNDSGDGFAGLMNDSGLSHGVTPG